MLSRRVTKVLEDGTRLCATSMARGAGNRDAGRDLSVGVLEQSDSGFKFLQAIDNGLAM